MILSISAPSPSDHRHAFVTPSRLPRTDRPDGKQFLIWSCSCGLHKAGDLLSPEEIDKIAIEYKKRVLDKEALQK